MLAVISLKILERLLIVLSELPDNVLTYIAIILLDFARHFKMILRRNDRHLSPFSHQVQHKLRDIATGNRDMLDGAPDDITFCARNNVRHAVARVDDGACQRAIRDAVRRPGGGEGEHGLHGDVEAFDVERFKEDFSRLLPILRWVKRRFSLYSKSICYSSGRKKRIEKKCAQGGNNDLQALPSDT